MTVEEKPTGVAGLSVTTPKRSYQPKNSILPSIEPSSPATSVTLADPPSPAHSDEREASPFSPFYSHPTTRYSLEASRTESKLNVARAYDSDLEAGMSAKDLTSISTHQLTKATTNSNPMCMMKSTNNPNCTVWPGRKALLMEKKRQRAGKKGFHPFAGLSKRMRITVKVLIAALIIGAAIGVGIGVSKAVGGGIWGRPNSLQGSD